MMQKVISQGWECPKCGKVYAPTQLECTRCPIPITYTSTGTEYNPRDTTSTAPHGFISKEGVSIDICAICGLGRGQHLIGLFT